MCSLEKGKFISGHEYGKEMQVGRFCIRAVVDNFIRFLEVRNQRSPDLNSFDGSYLRNFGAILMSMEDFIMRFRDRESLHIFSAQMQYLGSMVYN